MAHRDAVVHSDRIEQERDAARRADTFLNVVANRLEVDMPGDDVDVAVADRDEGFVPVGVDYAGGAEQAAVGGAGIASLDHVGTHGVALESDARRLVFPAIVSDHPLRSKRTNRRAGASLTV